MQKNILKIIFASILLRLSYFLFAFIVSKYAPETFHISLDLDSYIGISKRNDTGWYEKILKDGYPKITDKNDLGYAHGKYFKQSEWAFFPFYPLLIRYTSKIFNFDTNISFLICSIVFSAFAFIGFYKFCLLFLNDARESFYLTLVFMLFPFHYYFSMFYTEAVFFTFLIFSFIAIYKNKFGWLFILLIPLTLVRPNGIIITIPLFIYFLEQKNIINKKYIQWKDLIRRNTIVSGLAFLSAPLVLFVYCLYQHSMTGEYFAFSHAQAGWYRKFIIPPLSLFRSGDFATQFNSFYSIVIVILSAIAWKRFSFSLNIFIWINLLLILFSGPVAPRYVSVIFPLTIFIGEWFYKMKSRALILPVLLFLQLTTYYFWLIKHPFSY